ncbi:MAG: LysM peptidoglycan-binding domain-containing protein [Chloroflexota bacterium]|nr:LysM peptidoglycan-binding domain-containing protein [Chloroflexota bacterium]
MRARTWVTFITVNIIVSAMVMLTILFVWGRMNTSPPSAPASTPLPTDNTSSHSTIPSVASPATPGTLFYIVQAGDTLGGIAQIHGVPIEDLMAINEITDPNLLHAGQTLVIPTDPTPSPITGASVEPPSAGTPSPTPLPTLTPSGPPLIEIGQVLGSGDLETEVVVIRNRGGAVSLEGWTLSDAEGNTFTFPAITLFADTQMRVHSVAGRSTPSDLYWSREVPAWDGGELITLRDRASSVVDTYIVP